MNIPVKAIVTRPKLNPDIVKDVVSRVQNGRDLSNQEARGLLDVLTEYDRINFELREINKQLVRLIDRMKLRARTEKEAQALYLARSNTIPERQDVTVNMPIIRVGSKNAK